MRIIHGYGTGQLRRVGRGVSAGASVRARLRARRRTTRAAAASPWSNSRSIEGLMPLVPRHLRRRPEVARGHRAGRPGARAAAAERRRVEGAVPVPRREDAVVPRQRREGRSSTASAAAWAETSSSSSSCTTRSTFPDAVRQLAARVGLTVPEPEDSQGGRRRPARARSAAEGARSRGGVVPRAARDAGRRVGATAARRIAGLTAETIEHDWRRATRRRVAKGCKARLLKEGFARRCCSESGLLVQRDERTVAAIDSATG